MLGVTIEIPISGAVWLLIGQAILAVVLTVLVLLQASWTRKAVRSQSRGIQWILARLPDQIRMPKGLGIEGERRHAREEIPLEEFEAEIEEIERISSMTAEEWEDELETPQNISDHPVIRMTDDQIVALQKLRRNGGMSAAEMNKAVQEIEAQRRQS